MLHRRALLQTLSALALLPRAARAQTAPIAITIDRATPGLSVPPGFAGFSYEKSHTGYFTAANTPLIALFRRLGPGLLRIGGNFVETTHWTENGAGNTKGQYAPADIAALAAFANATDWKILYGLNLAANTPERAGAEAVMATRLLGDRLAGFEIGNEPDLYPINGNRPSIYSYANFEAEWFAYARAIRARVPDAVLTGPGNATSLATWTTPFARADTGITLLSQHYYRANGLVPSSTLVLLLAGHPGLPAQLQQIRAAAAIRGIPYRITEANSFYNGGAPNISNNFGTALWALDFLFINAQNGSAGVNFHGGGNTPGYTPIADDGSRVVQVRPGYYGMLLFSLAANGRLLTAKLSPTSLNISAYAIADGATTRLVIVNKEAATAANISIALGINAASATAMVLRAPSLSSTSGFTLGGAPINADGSWQPAGAEKLAIANGSVSIAVPAASAVLVTAN